MIFKIIESTAFVFSELHAMSKKLLLVDVDCGVDDAQALMLALAAPNVEILGITCCHGNSTIENVCRNVLCILECCNRCEIPVYSGASRPLLGKNIHASDYHGVDGLGDVPDLAFPSLEALNKEHAALAMLRIVSEHPGQVTVVATGPLTNLALAVNMDPTFPQKIKSLFIMGGNMESRGNFTACGEFNFSCDPEAAYIVLNSFDCPTHISTWEFTVKNMLPWTFYKEWITQDTHKADFMRKIAARSEEYTKKCTGEEGQAWTKGFVPCDSYAMAAAIDESFVTDVIHCAVSVELSGTLTRGMMVLDLLQTLHKSHKVYIITKCDTEKLKFLLMEALK
ncbi:PREDICTED: inosine-uridine preferring nucleoside hydrolase-like [Nanorana parkeri]|uniref:inosine-uridine preferring nucleoside hydrolase-like n=1 Tax=Nanorana parkeri TaxID=125878 RepID=UPI0008544B22|nr:PREDICTED: inosine-uridine preferring nucleoside hydrolase-like [Nanorana parkeri]